MVKKRTIYTASDGKEFDNEKEAEEHDKKVIPVSYTHLRAHET